MSSEAIGWAFKHSPYSGAHLVVHLAIADVVNDGHDHQFFMSVDKLAAKARASRRTAQTALKQLVDDGFLRIVKTATQHDPTRYQFIFRDTDAGVQNLHPSDGGVQSTTPDRAAVRGAIHDTQGCNPTRPGVQSRGAGIAPKPRTKKPRTQVTTASPSSTTPTRGDVALVDDDDRATTLILQASRIAATDALDRRREAEATGKTFDAIGDIAAWLDATAGRWRDAHIDRGLELLAAWPDTTAEQLPGLVDEYALPTPRPARPALVRELGCDECEHGWITDNAGDSQPCADCLPHHPGLSAGNLPQGATA